MSAKEKTPAERRKSNSIECKKAEIKARRITPYPQTKNKKLGKLVYPYKLQIKASAEIMKELSPKKSLIDPDSMLDLGDKISGKTLQCISIDKIKTEVIHDSSRHRTSRTVADKYVYCKVFRPFF